MYNGIQRFWFWAHKVLPLTYDDSLSYYEFLCKVLAKMNECIDKINELGTELDRFEAWTTDEFAAVRLEITEAIAVVESHIEALRTYVNGEVSRLDTKIDNSVTTINATITALDTRLSAEITALGNLVNVTAQMCAEEYDATQSYSFGAYCTHNGKLYVCIDNTSGVFEPSDWIETHVDQQLFVIKDMLTRAYDPSNTYVTGDYCYRYPNLWKCVAVETTGAFNSSDWLQATVMDEMMNKESAIFQDILEVNTRIGIVLGNLADDYDPQSTYNAGDYCIKGYTLYVCTQDNTTGTWDDTKWTATKVTEEILAKASSLRSLINSLSAETWNSFDQIATEYSTTATYNTGDYVQLGGGTSMRYYRCLQDGVTGQWVASKWQEVVVLDEVEKLNKQLGGYTIAYMTQADYDALVLAGTVDANTIYLTH